MSDRVGTFNRHSSNANNDGYIERAPREDMDTLFDLNRQGRRVESLMHVMALIRQYPEDKALYNNAAMTMTKLGEEAQKQGDEDGALQLWNSALQYALSGLKLDPGDTRLLTQTAKSYRQTGDYETAENFYLRAARIDPDDKFTWTGMGDMYVRWATKVEGHTDEEYNDLMQNAADCFSEASKIDPEDDKVWRRIDELEEDGYTPSAEGFDLDDPALDAINDAEMVRPQDFRFPNRAPGLDI